MNKPSNICDELDDYDEKGDCDYFEEPVEEVIIDDIKVEGKYKVFQDAILASWNKEYASSEVDRRYICAR